MKQHTRISPRLRGYDYSSEGAYFITICTKFREHYFGEIVNGEMKLSKSGRIVSNYRYTIPNHFKHLSLDEFIVMPNHIHGIIIITVSCRDDALRLLRKDKAVPLSLQPQRKVIKKHQIPKKGISPKPGSLAVVIGSYKSTCTKMIRKTCLPDFSWQGRYHEHIIRNKNEYNRICTYIQNNPKNRNKDIFGQ